MNRIRVLQDNRGFSLIEVLLGISVFMIGMLGVTALNISSLKSNTFSGNLSEATLLAAAQIEELMAMDFDQIVEKAGDDDGNSVTDRDGTGVNDDGIDGTGNEFGLNDIGAAADNDDNLGVGKLAMYDVYWNVAENEPITLPDVADQRTKIIRVIVVWHVKDEERRITMDVIRMKES